MSAGTRRWVVTGGGGQVGRCLARLLAAHPESGSARVLSHAECDIARPGAAERCLEGPGRPEVWLNAAAFTAVDACESDTDTAERVNAQAPGRLARACADAGVRFVHLSTDYVFDGEGSRPYREGDATGPRSVYGRTKLEGERRVLEASEKALVVRSSWIFGPGRNFVRSVLGQAALRRSGESAGPLRVVDDQRGSPTYAADLAQGVLDLVAAGAQGLFHLANAGEATWWDVARAALDETGHQDIEIERIDTASLDLPAPRPRYSVLDCSRAAAHGVSLRPWREALSAYLASPDREA